MKLGAARSTLLLSLSLSLGACGTAPSSDGEPLNSEREKSNLSKEAEDVKTLVSIDAKVLSLFPATKIVGSVLDGALNLLGQFDVKPDPFLALRSQLDGLSWQISQQALADDLAKAYSAVDQAKIAMRTGERLTANGVPMNESDEALRHAEQEIASEHDYVPVSEAIRRAVGEPDHPNDLVYDWRLGVSIYMQLVTMRLFVITAFDPDFMTDHTFDDELWHYRDVLLGHYQKMTDGVRCGVLPADTCSGFGKGCIDTYACIDIYTSTINTNADKYLDRIGVGPAYDLAKREIYHDMPLFEMRTMIDSLAQMTHGTPDLAPSGSPIYSGLTYSPDYREKGLCLDVQWGGTDNGTPVWIYDCDAPWYFDDSGRHLRTDVSYTDAQRWTYDRGTGELRNVGSGKCLDVSGVNPAQKTPVQIWDCVGNDGQRWTYDPQLGVLQNALGSVLDVQWGTRESQTPTWTYERNEGAAQQWLTPAI